MLPADAEPSQGQAKVGCLIWVPSPRCHCSLSFHTTAAVQEVPLKSPILSHPSRNLTYFGFALLALATSLLVAVVQMAPSEDSSLLFARSKAHRAKVSTGPLIAPSAQVEQDTTDYLGQTHTVDHADECLPIHIRDEGKISVLYLHCSENAYVHDGEAVDISEAFKVPESIARRYNFWRRIYSLWGKDQYVMHVAEYPEVVLEAFDGSRLGSDLGPVAREKQIKKVAKSERELYRKLLLAMHNNRAHEERFTPAMKRVAASMAHIKDPGKYLVAYQSLRLQRGQRDFIAGGLLTAPKYLPAIEKEFAAQDIPVEVTRLAFVESSFNLKAQSKVGASGVYQIMPATGKQYLKMLDGIDERNDPIKASRAAAKLLRLNYSLTGSWPLAITAYNHGVGGIRRATQAVHSRDIVDLINRYRGNQFGFASKNFYASFLGVLATLKDSNRIFPEVPTVQALVFTPVRLTKSTSMREVLRTYATSTTQIAELNPDIASSMLRSVRMLPAGYVIKVPPRAPAAALASESPRQGAKK